jgi:putative ubiquitin-RnfH superfamily antitoxin RatB of RatAB toxin-antitoxin module
MIDSAILMVGLLAGQTQIEPAHAQNSVYRQVLDQGLQIGGQKVELPRPLLVDGQESAAQRAALREVAGSDRALDDLLRDSVTAPYIIKVRDVKTNGATIRIADVWFVVYADLKQVDFGQEAARTDKKEVEVANMWFQTRLLTDEAFQSIGFKLPAAEPGQNKWYSHVHARLLDRIDFEATNQVMATQTPESIVIASRTDPVFARVPGFVNRWKPLAKEGTKKTDDRARPYEGGMSYAKISRTDLKPRAVLVEMHMAFVEPDGWFQGAPILRSKFSVVAQDQVRSLRRELGKKRSN